MLEATLATEKHYTAGEIAKLWQISDRQVIRIFADRPGVLRIGGKKRITIRIPESVLRAEHEHRAGGVIRELKRGRRSV